MPCHVVQGSVCHGHGVSAGVPSCTALNALRHPGPGINVQDFSRYSYRIKQQLLPAAGLISLSHMPQEVLFLNTV